MNCLMGKKPPAFRPPVLELGFARLPVAMLLWYLENIYIKHNGLRKTGHLSLNGTPVERSRIRTPCFVLATKEESAAAQRPDSNILPLPGSRRGGAAGKVVTALLSLGQIRQLVIDRARPIPHSTRSGATSRAGSACCCSSRLTV